MSPASLHYMSLIVRLFGVKFSAKSAPAPWKEFARKPWQPFRQHNAECTQPHTPPPTEAGQTHDCSQSPLKTALHVRECQQATLPFDIENKLEAVCVLYFNEPMWLSGGAAIWLYNVWGGCCWASSRRHCSREAQLIVLWQLWLSCVNEPGRRWSKYSRSLLHVVTSERARYTRRWLSVRKKRLQWARRLVSVDESGDCLQYMYILFDFPLNTHRACVSKDELKTHITQCALSEWKTNYTSLMEPLTVHYTR